MKQFPNRSVVLVLSLYFFFAEAMAIFAGGSVSLARPVRMASLQNDLHHLPFWVALDQGFYQQVGVDVEVAGTFHAGPELMTAMRAGGIDAGYVGEAPATIAFARGFRSFQLVAQVNTGGSAIVVAADSKVRDLAGLKGRRIAVPGSGTVQDFLLRRSLDRAGLSARDVHILTLSPSEMSTALKGGQIDAFISWQPFPARALVRGEGRILADSAQLWPDHPCCALVVVKQFVDDGTAAKLVQAHSLAVDFIRTHPDEACSITMKHTGMDEKTVREALSHVSYTVQPRVDAEEEYVHFLNSLGLIQETDSHVFTREFIADPTHGKGGKAL